jgi:hypothetical protein
MVDQDLSFFNDSPPLFTINELGAAMPDSDRLWRAKTAPEWSAVFNQVHEFTGGYSSIGSGARPLPLRDMFRLFIEDEIVSRGIELTPVHLRLLLHPLQALTCQYQQLMSCFGDSSNGVMAGSARARQDELQVLLKRWHNLAERYLVAHPVCPMIQASMVMYHLISLNTITNFLEIERLARKEGFDGTYQQLAWAHRKCIGNVEEALFHSGQVFRLVRGMAPQVRPPWWPGAIYRAALILWTESLMRNDTVSPSTGMFPVPGPSFAIDAQPDHPLITRYLSKREGVPTLTKRDGTQMAIDNGFSVLAHCIEIIDEGISNRFADGIRNKLDKLARSL